MLTFDRPPWSLVAFLAIVVVGATLLGETVSGLILAFFLYLLACVNAKPSWRRIWDPDRRGESGVLRFSSWRRAGHVGPDDRRPNY